MCVDGGGGGGARKIILQNINGSGGRGLSTCLE